VGTNIIGCDTVEETQDFQFTELGPEVIVLGPNIFPETKRQEEHAHAISLAHVDVAADTVENLLSETIRTYYLGTKIRHDNT
jgi:hypothetical protein